MATSDWAIPTGKAITGATYIKDTDNNIAATIEDLRDWCNNANGTYTDWTLTGLRTDFVDINTAQTITAVKTIDTLGAIDFTGGELRVGGVAVTSSAAELNLLDGATVTTAEINILDGVTSTATELNVLDGISPTLTAAELSILDGVTATADELNILDGVTSTTTELNILDGVTATASDLNKTSNILSGTWTPTIAGGANVDGVGTLEGKYTRVGDMVHCSIPMTVSTLAGGGTLTELTFTLPIASNFISVNNLSGVGIGVNNNLTNNAIVEAETTLDRATLRYYSTGTLGVTFRIELTYQVI